MLNKSFLFLIISFLPLIIFSQDCNFQISGQVTDTDTGKPLEAVSIYIQETQKGGLTDENGNFLIKGICAGEYHLVFSHVACESHRDYIIVKNDTILNKRMDHSAHILHHVVVQGSNIDENSQHGDLIQEQVIRDNSHENLANLLETITGVSSIKNGQGISKPVVHGLYGNRLSILNNGVSQSGQQWGADHSPEIDALTANKIQVMKGTSSLEYMGSNLGSVILVEPNKIGREPHIHGRASYFFESNGRSHGANVQAQQYAPLLSWKINATLKKSGDRKTSSYFLNNTGNQEANIALQLEKAFSESFFVDFYASSFNTELGVLRGAHVGNLTDLEDALARDIPFFTEANFSYGIDAPKQRVHHQFAKLHAKYFLKDQQWLEATFATQYNNRLEFDVRRNEKTNIPSLSLQQLSIYSELKYVQEWSDGLIFKSGIQNNFTDNTNNPETGILPLIPDYFSYETAGFALLSKKYNRSFFDIGFRYDHVLQKVAKISNTLPREILRYSNSFHNLGGSLGYIYQFNDDLSLNSNLGYSTRNPGINELYSGGLHQGVSGIEEGDTELLAENAIKATLGLEGHVSIFNFEFLSYFQRIDNYIYLNPQEEIRLTIRGAFPVFKYEQTQANIYGLDFSSRVSFSHSFYADLKYSYIQATDLTNKVNLINIPSNNANFALTYHFNKPLKLGTKKLENIEFEINDQYVFKKEGILLEQDFVASPEAYNLLGMKAVGEMQIRNTRWRFTAKVDNLLNEKYRDYLNRQRYFADDIGLNIIIGLGLKF